ncbi:MAG: hypothetical protein AABW48_00395 [Nanoarchaeota archaeon]
MSSINGAFFRIFDRFWNNLRLFSFYNRTIFEIFFIFLYAIEQVALVWYTFNSKNTESLGYVVSIFAIMVLVTFALHKLIMESRIKILENQVGDLGLDKIYLESRTKEAQEIYNELFTSLSSQGLNNSFNSLKQDKKVKK